MKLEEQRRQCELEQKRLEFEQMKWKEEMEMKMIEKAHRESPAAKIKIWGDALRNTISRMPTEGIDVVSWFVSVEKLLEQLSVPAELQSILIKPYFSEIVKLLMSKCDAAVTHAASYESMKKFLLQELHLSPSVYLDKFNAFVRDKDETFGQFSTRLMSLFEYYVESRKVGHSYDKLKRIGKFQSQTHVTCLT